MSSPVFAAIVGFLLVLGVLETFFPGKMDNLMSRVAGRRYTSAASDRLRVRWIRLNGLMLLAFSGLMFFTLLGRL